MEMDDYIRAFAGEVQRDGTAQAFGGTGYQSDFSGEVAAIRIRGRHLKNKKIAQSTNRRGRQFL
jgi:hypothetical protein